MLTLVGKLLGLSDWTPQIFAVLLHVFVTQTDRYLHKSALICPIARQLAAWDQVNIMILLVAIWLGAKRATTVLLQTVWLKPATTTAFDGVFFSLSQFCQKDVRIQHFSRKVIIIIESSESRTFLCMRNALRLKCLAKRGFAFKGDSKMNERVNERTQVEIGNYQMLLISRDLSLLTAICQGANSKEGKVLYPTIGIAKINFNHEHLVGCLII